MPIMLFILIPLVILAAVVLVYELKRHRRPAAAVDMASRVRAVRGSTEAKHGITPPGGGPS
jgi:predicted membrane-bound mannosyltransferase